jgi:hypothetical protein
MEKKDPPPPTKKKFELSKGFLEQKGDDETPTTKLRGLPQGLGKSPSDFYKIVGKGKGQDSPTLLQLNLGELEKEVEEGGDVTETLAKFQNILLETGKEIKKLREQHFKSKDDGTNKDRQGP